MAPLNCFSRWAVVVDSTYKFKREKCLVQADSLTYGVPPAWHLSESTHSRTYAKRPFAAELYRNQAEWLITRGNKGEFSTREEVWLQLREFGSGEHLLTC